MPRSRSRFWIAVIACLGAHLAARPVQAQSTAPAPESATPRDAEPVEAAPPAPPPGISIMPSMPYMAPRGDVPGCPAGRLKPLELLV